MSLVGRRRALSGLAGAAGALAVPGLGRAQDRRVVTARIALENNRVLLDVGLAGAGPYRFMLDTGAYVSLIRPDLAKQLKLQVRGVERSSGVAGRPTDFNVYLARDVTIGGAIRQPTAVFQDSFEFGHQQGIYGALAAGVLTSFDSELDFDAGELRIYPDGRGPREGYTAVDAIVPRADRPDRGSRKLIATLLVDGKLVRCVVDTGAPHVLMLTQSTARRLGYLDAARAYAPFRPNGIGGRGAVARVVRADTLTLGAVGAERPLIVALGNELGGDVDGIVGLSFLRRANLSIDARAGRLYVAPSRQALVPERYGLSGLWLDRDARGIGVVAVGAGSPAAAAGVRVGDRVAGEWNATLAAIGGAPGRTAALSIEREGAAREVRLPLAPYL